MTAEEQLAMPFDVRIEPTPAMAKGESRVDQCAWCGLLVCCDKTVTLGKCPGCGRRTWWRQQHGRPGGHFSGPFYHRTREPSS